MFQGVGWTLYCIAGLVASLGLGAWSLKDKQYRWFVVDCIGLIVFTVNLFIG